MKAIDITNSNSNNLAQSRFNTNYWSPLTNLVDELEEEAETKNGTSAAAYNIESGVEKRLREKKKKEQDISPTEKEEKAKPKNTQRKDLSRKIHVEPTTKNSQEFNTTIAKMEQLEQEMDEMLSDFDKMNTDMDKKLELANKMDKNDDDPNGRK